MPRIRSATLGKRVRNATVNYATVSFRYYLQAIRMSLQGELPDSASRYLSEIGTSEVQVEYYPARV
jgi:hypothetical protein